MVTVRHDGGVYCAPRPLRDSASSLHDSPLLEADLLRRRKKEEIREKASDLLPEKDELCLGILKWTICHPHQPQPELKFTVSCDISDRRQAGR